MVKSVLKILVLKTFSVKNISVKNAVQALFIAVFGKFKTGSIRAYLIYRENIEKKT